MAYVDADTIHTPTTGAAAPATWGQQLRDNQEHFANVQNHDGTAGSGGHVPGTPIFASTTQVDSNNETTERTLLTGTLPGGTLGSDQLVQAYIRFSIFQQGGTSGTMRCKLGTTTMIAIGSMYSVNVGGTDYLNALFDLWGDGTTNAQQASGNTMGARSGASTDGNSGNGVAAELSSGDLTIAITWEWASASPNAQFSFLSGYVNGPFNP